ncbi:hypothetical protein PoB_004480900 [Plakobranchus ocellatus]|uniref:Uncharacterized protein n=1 Tax=Plakobranchus ocellatus TaxID=259542 RepID=A0AAV4BDT5_9GAST|nr:hypothetical protein PoB_004480900 [Plakobranchus ocellatus]
MWFIRRMIRISWTGKKSNELVLKEANLQRSLIKTIRRRPCTSRLSSTRHFKLLTWQKQGSNLGNREPPIGCGYWANINRFRTHEYSLRELKLMGRIVFKLNMAIYTDDNNENTATGAAATAAATAVASTDVRHKVLVLTSVVKMRIKEETARQLARTHCRQDTRTDALGRDTSVSSSLPSACPGRFSPLHPAERLCLPVACLLACSGAPLQALPSPTRTIAHPLHPY